MAETKLTVGQQVRPRSLGLGQRIPVRRVIQRDLVVAGVALGAVYALIALGYTLVYGILLMINFAHGEVFMAGAYGSFFVAAPLERSGYLDRNLVTSLLLLMLVSMAAS